MILECKINGSINLYELDSDLETEFPNTCIVATPDEMKKMNMVLTDFVSNPLAYDLVEMCTEEDMQELAIVCEGLRKELLKY